MRAPLVTIAIALAMMPALARASDIAGVPRIVDGDTVEISGTKLRLLGIDAPESDQLCLDGHGQRWACGVQAREALQQHAGAKAWTCATTAQDRYGRSLATCSADGEDLDRWMVRSGWALSFVRYGHTYDADEKAARDARVGLWAGAFIAPWDWRARNEKTAVLGAVSIPVEAQKILLGAASASEAPDPSCTIKGNVTRAGECIYHLPGGRWYARVTMKPGSGKRWFCSEAEAQAAGCRPAAQ